VGLIVSKLVFGVLDIPYANAPRAKGSKAKSGTQTTGDVAQWLEDEYHIMEVFAAVHAQDIAHDLEHSVVGALNSILNGAPASLDVFGSATSKIEERMKNFILTGEMEKLGIPNVPTQAALNGVSHRFANAMNTSYTMPLNKKTGKRRKKALKKPQRDARVSFYDTGLYETSMKAWIEK